MANRYRLDRSIDPHFYALAIQPNLAAWTFTGEARIDIRIRRPVTRITLNAIELKLTHAAIRRGRTVIPARRITYNEQLETATLHFGTTVPAGPARVELAFSGLINRT